MRAIFISNSLIAAMVLATAVMVSCAGLESRPDVYALREANIQLVHQALPITLVIPQTPQVQKTLVLYATGDDSFRGTNNLLLVHLAERGFKIAAFDSNDVLSRIKRAEGQASLVSTAIALDKLLMQAKRELGLPDTTPTIFIGFSRGSNLLVLAAGEPDLRRHLLGGIAVALPREDEKLKEPDPARRTPAIQVDPMGRLQTYPSIEHLGTLPLAVIQSAGDKYVRAEESRVLIGSDTSTRRLFEVDAKNHAFKGGHLALLRDLDEALTWISSR